MDTVVLTASGVAALGYVLYVTWRSVSGKRGCNCVSAGSCPANGCCKAGNPGR